MMTIEMIAPEGIMVTRRARGVDPKVLESIKQSIKALRRDGGAVSDGIINPLTVRRLENGCPELVCGLHRLHAATELKLEAVPCHVIKTEDDKERRLIEIAENYCTADLSQGQRSEHARDYAELEAWVLGKHGGDRRSRSPGDLDRQKPSAIKELSERSGRGKTAVTQDLIIAKTVDPTVLSQVVGTPIDSRRELTALGKLPRDEQRRIAKQWSDPKAKRKVKPTTVVGQRRRADREHDLAEKIDRAAKSLGAQRHGVILADPPWSRETYSDAGKSRDPSNHYPTMTFEEMAATRVPAADDCVLAMWTTGEHLAQAMRLIEAWGFEYKSMAVWVKPRIGTGYWFRTKHELLLVATRGKPVAPAQGTQPPSVFEAPVAKHSAKPTWAHEWIEANWPTTSKLEMFARAGRAGWSAWGAEAT